MRFGSVCSGVEAASVAFGPLGWKAAWLAEVDVAASAVLAHRYGATAPVYPLPNSERAMKRISWGDRLTNWGDMTKLPDLVRSGEAEAPDVLCGGTPCQSFSVAGRREGLTDGRGQLTLSFVDLADAIDSKRAERGDEPCVIFWENVPGVLSDKTNAFGCFLAALAGEDVALEPPGPKWSNAGCVFGPQRTIAWRVLDAQYFGVAQRRRRVFVVASARDGFDPCEVLFERDGLRRDTAPSREKGQGAAADAGTGFTPSSFGAYREGLGTLRAAGGDFGGGSEMLVPQKGYRMVAFGEYADDDTASAMKARDYKDATDLAVSVTGDIAHTVALRGREGGATAELGGEIATALRASTGGGCKPHVLTVHGTQDPITLDDLGLALGRNSGQENAVLVSSANAFAQNTRDEVRLLGGDGEICGALAAQPEMKQTTYVAPAVAIGLQTAVTPKFNHDLQFTLTTPSPTAGGQPAACMDTSMAVRRLTPTECERLQGFPDGHTLVPTKTKRKLEEDELRRLRSMSHEKMAELFNADPDTFTFPSDDALRELAADGPRYKQMGNSWPVPVVRWLGRRIKQQVAVDPMTVWLLCA